jgi:hypothetical protein
MRGRTQTACSFKAWVAGSSPAALTKFSKYLEDFGRVDFGHPRTPRRVSTQLGRRFALSISREISPGSLWERVWSLGTLRTSGFRQHHLDDLPVCFLPNCLGAPSTCNQTSSLLTALPFGTQRRANVFEVYNRDLLCAYDSGYTNSTTPPNTYAGGAGTVGYGTIFKFTPAEH